MGSENNIAGWCPACGEELSRRYPRCTKDRTPTPMYVEVNAVAQCLVGVPTFVEFRLLNTSDDPVTLESFDVRLAGRSLEAGVHTEEQGREIAPREEQALILDRKIDFGIDKVMPGEYSLDIEIAYTCEGRESRLKSSHPVRFAQPTDRRLYAYNHASETFDTFEGGRLPEVEPIKVGQIGERNINDQRIMHLCRMKHEAGLRFVPLRASLVAKETDAPASWTKSQLLVCENCGALLKENGLFCHACGGKQSNGLAGPPPTEQETGGYCPHCTFPRGRLRGRYRFCPICGQAIDAHVSISALPAYMAGVQVRTKVRIRATAREPVRVSRIRAFIGERITALECGFLEDVGYGIRLAPDEIADLTCLIHCPPEERTGDRKLTLELEYECGDRFCRLSGSTDIRVIPGAEKLGTIIHQYGAQEVSMAGDAIMSQGAWNINQADSLPKDKREDFMQKLAELAEVPERPLHLHTVSVSTVGPAIAWEPSHRATLWFMHEGIHHRYCIATMYRPESGQYEPVSFGRRRDLNLIRLYDIEDVLERQEKEKATDDMSLSMVSSMQWVVQVSEETSAVGLEFTHRSQNNISFVGKAKKLAFGEKALLGLNEQIECRRKSAAKPVIGLQYGAHALRFPAYEAARNRARAALDTMAHPPERYPEWPARIGGYRLNRLHSLTGEMIPERKDLQTMEAYVLLPAWASIGSSEKCCIVVPGEGIAPTHAYVLHVDGYFFILPHSVETRVVVDGHEVPADVPWPLNPDKVEIQLGETTVKFDRFCQAFLG